MHPIASDAPSIRLVVGLGNPGPEYVETRHNVGFMILDRLAGQFGTAFTKERAWSAAVAQSSGVVLCKPLTYMNRSGSAVQSVCSFYKIPPSEVLVVLDEMALPLGKIRLRQEGSAGGHNGMKSIIEHLGTPSVARLRVGIGAAEPGAAVDHVLGKFDSGERTTLDEVIARSLEAVECARRSGLAQAMNSFN